MGRVFFFFFFCERSGALSPPSARLALSFARAPAAAPAARTARRRANPPPHTHPFLLSPTHMPLPRWAMYLAVARSSSVKGDRPAAPPPLRAVNETAAGGAGPRLVEAMRAVGTARLTAVERAAMASERRRVGEEAGGETKKGGSGDKLVVVARETTRGGLRPANVSRRQIICWRCPAARPRCRLGPGPVPVTREPSEFREEKPASGRQGGVSR